MKGKYIVVGISNIDIYTGKTNIFQFKEIYILAQKILNFYGTWNIL
jgi:hypothetical protein